MLQWRLENQEKRAQQEEHHGIEIANIKKSFGRTQVLNDIHWIFLQVRWSRCWGRPVPGNHAAAHYRRAGASNQRAYSLHGTDVSRLHARDRKVGFVFQITRCSAI